MAQSVTVDGAARCSSTLRSAGAMIASPVGAAAGASRVVAAGAGMRAPRATGRLAVSVRAMQQGPVAAAGSSLRYAPYVHWGTSRMRARPFLDQAARATEPVWIALYQQGNERALGTVKGV